MPNPLLTPDGEPVVVYMLVFSSGRSAYAGTTEDEALDFMDAFPGSRLVPCHLLPLPEDARTVKRGVPEADFGNPGVPPHTADAAGEK